MPVWKALSWWGNDVPAYAMATISSTRVESSGFVVPISLCTIASDIP